MRTFRALGLYGVAVGVVALALSFPVQALCQHFGWLAGKPWSKFFSVSAKVAVLACLWPLLRALGMAGWQAIGLRSARAAAASRFLAGWGSGFFGAMLLGAAAVAAGNRVWQGGPWPAFWGPLATGLFVGAFEEFFFRGLIFGALRHEWDVGRAVWVSSVFYAVLHFVGAPPKSLAGAAPALMSLTGFGLLLCWCYLRSGSLYLSMGVHAGCVTALKWWGDLTERGTGGLEWLFGSGRFKLVNGLAAVPMLLLLWLVLIGVERFMRRFYAGEVGNMGPGGSRTVLPG